jgi:hypothetical protein
MMAENESSSGRSQPNPERPLLLPRSDEIDRSVFGRFNSLIVDFVSLLFGFISLFGRVGNSHTGVSQYLRNISDLPPQARSRDGPES